MQRRYNLNELAGIFIPGYSFWSIHKTITNRRPETSVEIVAKTLNDLRKLGGKEPISTERATARKLYFTTVRFELMRAGFYYVLLNEMRVIN